MLFPRSVRIAALLTLATAAAHGQSPNASRSDVTHTSTRDAERVTESVVSLGVDANASVDPHGATAPSTWQSGADIVRLNVDSIMRVLPASSLSALLETRVPGLVVAHTSGEPGAPTFIRLRGASSVALSNAPIIIVDGIRVSGDRNTGGSVNMAPLTFGATSTGAPSAIDQIDPNMIDHLEILRGPAAAARYGSDAAHGVIVITTKRGVTGETRWSASVSAGQSSRLGDYPAMYFPWGHSSGGGIQPDFCSVTEVESGACVADSVTTFQALNDSRYAPFDDGQNLTGSLSLSGGARRLTNALTGSATNATGIVHLPGLEAAHYQSTHGFAAPDWMRDPDAYDTWSGSGMVGLDLGRNVMLSLMSRQFGGRQQSSPLAAMIPLLEGAYIDPTMAAQSGFLPDYTSHITSNAHAATYGGALEWPVVSWLPLHAAYGVDRLQRDDAIRTPPGYDLALDTIGYIRSGTFTEQTQTANLTTQLPVRLFMGYTMPIAVGVTMERAWERIGQRTSTYPQTLGSQEFARSAIPQTTVGVYLEPHIALPDRLSLTPGIRWDRNSVSNFPGVPSHASVYTSLSASWQALEASPERMAIIPALRFRSAYGQAGAQSGPDEQLQLANPSMSSSFVDGPFFTHPERSHELEGGVDLEWLGGRIGLGATTYDKETHNTLVSAVIGVSPFPPGGTAFETFANVRNRGLELSLTTQILQRRSIAWTVDANLSRNNNQVTQLTGLGIPSSSTPGAIDVAPGTSLFGQWARPILGFVDQNHDGFISSSEIALGDSSAYLGPQIPPTTVGINSAIRLFNGRLSVHTSFEYDDGMTLLNYASTMSSLSGMSLMEGKASNYGYSTLAQQAAFVALPYTYAGAVQSGIHMLRWSALAVNYIVPRDVSERVHIPSATLTLEGENLAMHSNYSGIDPSMTTFPTGNTAVDMGQVAMPRTWSLRVRLGQ